jgi:hypothetical protein
MIKRKPVRPLLGVGVSLGLILVCVMSVTSALASPAVNISIVPASHTAVVNDIFTVNITLSGPDPVRGAMVYIDFDNTYLEVQSITPGTALDTVLANDYDNGIGAINYSAGKLTGTMPTGTFTLATIQLKALAPTTTPTPLTFVYDAPNNRVTDVITSGSVSVLGTATGGVVTISAAAVPTVAFSAATYSVGEGGGSAIITVHLSAASTGTVTVHYATSGGTATAGSDYTTATGTLTFSPGQTSKTFSVPILEDTSVEANETVNLVLSSPTGATLGTPSTAVLTIVDNDVTPVGGTAYPPNKLLMLAPWIALGAAIIVATSLLARRRRSAAR